MPDTAFCCPVCRSPLDSVLVCAGCGRRFAREHGIPVLLPPLDRSTADQAAWFDEPDDPEWETVRPHGAPRFHRWLLAEKFSRSTRGVDLRGASVLVVCGGSGMDAEFLARAGARVVASDISVGAARRTAARANRFHLDIEPLVADVAKLPFEGGAFDIAYVHDGLHHIEDPFAGLDEMARVARSVVCLTEPAQAFVTSVAMKVGIALDREAAGNEVARLRLEEVIRALERRGFRTMRARRYAMMYRHEPGWPMRVLSWPGIFPVAKHVFRLVDALIGRVGNKLTLVAVREGAADEAPAKHGVPHSEMEETSWRATRSPTPSR